MTVTQLLDAGIAKAGTPTGRRTVVKTEFLADLRKLYASWPWPFTLRRFSDVALASGVQTLSFGNGTPDVDTPAVSEVKDPLYLYTSDYRSQRVVRARTIIGGPVELDEHANSDTGTPSLVKVRASSGSPLRWDLVFEVAADEDFLLAIDAHVVPADPADGDVPLYPNDITLIKMVEVIALHDSKAENAANEHQLLSVLRVNDRSTYGTSPGLNAEWGLDPLTFR